ncbi:MAG: hypothetical protein ACRD8U_06430, partial [Pyrinomonadaceae bacterium]
RLLESGARTLESYLSSRLTAHELHFKKTAYNWLAFSHDHPPCFDEHGRHIPQTKFGTVYFQDRTDRDLAFLVLNGKIQFAYWVAIGDDFDVTKWMFADLPIDLRRLGVEERAALLPFVVELRERMNNAIQFKLNAGKRVGNYNLAKCRSVTDETDAIIAKAYGLDRVLSDIDLLYVQIVKTDFEESA